jgi:site-specific recombinase XerD
VLVGGGPGVPASVFDLQPAPAPHVPWHSFTTSFLRNTKNLRVGHKALTHAHITTTTIYTHIGAEELEEAMKNLRRMEWKLLTGTVRSI